ncbi:putative nucleotidyltransferase [Salinibacter ruber]|uniref:nucleotidyltransferase family protein n=1 Tax=Salinibacter ruber TaxID=146919 RepID=UPI0020744D9E|nr:nucleotidyltransferase domain-containing protein [Salinibacter ruber]MCS3749273.1 putative nucleotidyltransferase [Salinibacter ruber]MCS4045004.1 putative nucleotidyltransferase [Salinibacter ruber]
MPDPLASYRDTMRRRGGQARREQERRRRRARKTARRVAEYLRHAYGAARVVLFRPMAGDEVPLGPRSDIDLAVRGLDKEDYFEAVARVQDEAVPFQVDLVRIEQCPESLHEVIRREGCDV